MLLALTLHQPWAALLFLPHPEMGLKDIENRTWAPSPGRLAKGHWFAVHAGLGVDRDSMRDLLEAVGAAPDPQAHAPLVALARVRGAFLGTVRFDGCVRTSSSRWFNGPIGWRVAEPKLLSEPLPCRGERGLWAAAGPFELVGMSRGVAS